MWNLRRPLIVCPGHAADSRGGICIWNHQLIRSISTTEVAEAAQVSDMAGAGSDAREDLMFDPHLAVKLGEGGRGSEELSSLKLHKRCRGWPTECVSSSSEGAYVPTATHVPPSV